MTETILFDIDNTLIDHSSAELTAIESIRNDFFPNIPRDEFIKVWNQVTQDNWLKFERGEMTFEEQRVSRIQDVWRKFEKLIDVEESELNFNRYLSEYEKAWTAFDGIQELLAQLQQPLGIISNGDLRQQVKKLRSTGLLELFRQDLIFASGDIGIAKPASGIFRHVQSVLRVDASKILYIGDKLNTDVRPAIKEGWNAIWVDHHDFYEDVDDTPRVVSVDALLRSISNYE